MTQRGTLSILSTTILGLFLSLLLFSPVVAQETSAFSIPKTFRDWWQTPDQQAQSAWNQGDNERLSKVAPSNQWRAAAAYRKGDYETAKEAYSSALNGEDTENSSVPILDNVAMSVFNQATTDIQLGNYASAIEQLDALLAEQPEHSDAIRNRAIAERLLELEQQPQEGEGQGEQGEQSESDASDSDDAQNADESGDSSESEQQEGADGEESSEPSDESSEQGEPSGDPSDSESEDSSDSATGNEQSDDEIEAARQALQAASDAQQDESSETDAQPIAAELSDEPISEQDQATEQWLRQIPDDPDDLLRRKLLQNHRSEYPDVQVNGRGW